MSIAVVSRVHPRRFWLALAVLALLATWAVMPNTARALPPPPAVPAPLQPWAAWALHDQPALLCSSVGDGRTCVWPGHLAVRVDDKGGTFELAVWLDRDWPVRLPGDKTLWPQHVQVDGAVAAVQAQDDVPAVRVPAGHHKITGSFAWPDLPELLALPDDLGVVELTLRGTVVDNPHRDDAGHLRLQKDGGLAKAETDSLTIAVARKLMDGVPLRMDTRLALRVGGKARDVTLGPVLPAGWRPVALQDDSGKDRPPLPVQMSADGALRVHVRPGQFVVVVRAVLDQPTETITVPTLQGPGWEQPETWVWQPNELVRSVELGGLVAVDPERTQLPDAWKKTGRTLLGSPGQALTLKQTRRGEVQAAPNQLHLTRSWWLDLDGQGLTSRDVLTGEMYQGWRLQAAPGWQLGRTAVDGQNQLITLGEGATATAAAGVELRKGKVRIEADLRVPTVHGPLQVVGWRADVQSLQGELHLPPGWKLLAAKGVDELPGTWPASWTLLDFFFVLMVAVGLGKLLGMRWGALALLTLVLCHGEADAPEFLWLMALIGLALLAVLPASPLRKLVGLGYGGVLALLVIVVLPFATHQLRHGLYPQVESERNSLNSLILHKDAAPEPAMAPPPPTAEPTIEADAIMAPAGAGPDGGDVAPAAKEESDDNVAGVRDAKPAQRRPGGAAKSLLGYDISSRMQVQQIDPQAVVQTGPGVPTWSWTRWQLKWSGPVRADHQIELYLLNPWQNLALAILRVLAVLALTARLVDWSRLRRLMGRLQVDPSQVGPVAALLLACGLTMLPRAVHADPGPAEWNNQAPVPPADVLGELGKRLQAAQTCEGPCLVVSQVTLRVDGQNLQLQADLSAQRAAAWTIPGPLEAVQLRKVSLDDQPTWDLRRADHGLLQVRVPTGHHVVTVEATLPARNVVDVQLGQGDLPHHLVFTGKDWTIDGVDATGLPQQSLQLTRAESAAKLPAAATTSERGETSTDLDVPAWHQVERHLLLGLPWKVRTVVTREVTYLPQFVKVPLLPGEVLLSDGVRVEEAVPGHPEKGKVALVNFARGEGRIELEGQLPMPDDGATTLILRAPQGEPWTETWQLECSPIWRCESKGLTPVLTRDPAGHVLRPQWQPWPGETVQIDVQRPRGAPGQSVTIDAVNYDVTPGQRLLAATLTLDVRASQGGWQKLTLPPGAEVQVVTIKGQPKTLRPKDSVLQVPLEPGAQKIVVTWQQPWQRSVQEGMPAVHVGGPASNVRVTLHLGEDRWLLWAHGPRWGAAVLFWSRLLLVLLAAIALGRLRNLPLRTHHWLALGLGLAPLPPPLLLLVVGWFVAMGWRQSYGQAILQGTAQRWAPTSHDALQLGLGAWTVVAMGVLYGAIHTNLLLDVDMQVGGMDSTSTVLRWYVDRVDGALPAAGVLSAPLWLWRGGMLLWAMWLVAALLRWLPWAWRALVSGGGWAQLSTVPSKKVEAPHVVPPGPPPAGKAPVPGRE